MVDVYLVFITKYDLKKISDLGQRLQGKTSNIKQKHFHHWFGSLPNWEKKSMFKLNVIKTKTLVVQAFIFSLMLSVCLSKQ